MTESISENNTYKTPPSVWGGGVDEMPSGVFYTKSKHLMVLERGPHQKNWLQ